jgi:hypothetical protein
MRGDSAVAWTLVSKDGYPLPAAQREAKPARLMFTPGEIYDFEFTPTTGDLSLTFGPPPPPPNAPPLPPVFQPPPPRITVPVRIR